MVATAWRGEGRGGREASNDTDPQILSRVRLGCALRKGELRPFAEYKI